MNKVYMTRCLFELEMIKGEFAVEFINESSKIISRLAYVKITFDFVV